MGEERRKPDPRRTHRPPDLAGPQFPLWTKGACDSLHSPNRELTHSGLSFSRCPAGLGSGPRSHACAPLPSLHHCVRQAPTAPPPVGSESRDSEPTSSGGEAILWGLRSQALPGNSLPPSSPLASTTDLIT